MIPLSVRGCMVDWISVPRLWHQCDESFCISVNVLWKLHFLGFLEAKYKDRISKPALISAIFFDCYLPQRLHGCVQAWIPPRIHTSSLTT